MSRILQVNSFDLYKTTVKSLLEKNEKVYGYFLSSVGPNGVLWCPDCVAVDPMVRPLFEKKADGPTVIVWLERDFYRSNKPKFAADPDVLLRAVPQVNMIVRGGEHGRIAKTLIEGEITEAALTNLFAAKL